MFQNEIEREKPPHNNRLAGLSPVADVLNAQRPVDRVARYAACLSTAIHNRPLALDRLPSLHQCLHEAGRFPSVSVTKVMAELRPREDAAMQTDERDPFRVGSGPAERFQFAISSPQVLDHLLIRR